MVLPLTSSADVAEVLDRPVSSIATTSVITVNRSDINRYLVSTFVATAGESA